MISAGRGHVAQLLRSTGHDRARKDRIALRDEWIVCKIAVAHERADDEAAARCGFDLLQRQTGDVDNLGRALDIHLHQIDQIGAARDELCARVAHDPSENMLMPATALLCCQQTLAVSRFVSNLRALAGSCHFVRETHRYSQATASLTPVTCSKVLRASLAMSVGEFAACRPRILLSAFDVCDARR